MKIEYEVRFLEIDKDKIIAKLNEMGAKDLGDSCQIRKTYDFIEKRKNSWLRLRTNGKETTLTVKQIDSDKIDGTKELEVVVSDFNETDAILTKVGLSARNFQENRRHKFLLNDVEIDIDTWPRIPTFMEIEGNDEESIKNVCDYLGLDYNKSTTMDVTDIYRDIYGIDILSIKELKF